MNKVEGSASQYHQLFFVLGGAGSGKSIFAEKMIARMPPPWIYIATAEPRDEEMTSRIDVHQKRRDCRWQLREAYWDLPAVLASVSNDTPLLVDCLTLWLSNIMLADKDLGSASDALVDVLSKPRGPWCVVANEVGQGIVPDNALARRYRDEAGKLNQRIAAIAHQVDFVTAGLAQRLKG